MFFLFIITVIIINLTHYTVVHAYSVAYTDHTQWHTQIFLMGRVIL